MESAVSELSGLAHGGVQGLNWVVAHQRVDEDGDVADGFLMCEEAPARGAEASATPPMTGIKERYTGNGYTVPETKYTPRAENTGSNVFTVCVNETATVAKDTFDKQCPNACKNAGNVNAFKNVGEGFSNLTSLVVQKNVMMSKPTPKCTQDTNHGNGK